MAPGKSFRPRAGEVHQPNVFMIANCVFHEVSDFEGERNPIFFGHTFYRLEEWFFEYDMNTRVCCRHERFTFGSVAEVLHLKKLNFSVAGFDGAVDAAARRKLAFDDAPFRFAGFHHIPKNPVHRVLIKNSQFAISEQIHL